MVLPFTDVWPGDQLQVNALTLRARWGLLLNRQGKLWSNRGYSGGRDSLSYEAAQGRMHFTAAANSRFIFCDGEIYDNIRNATRTLHL